MPKKVTAYVCEFGCGWVSATERSAKFHEELCVYNPQNQSCHTCDYAIDMMNTAGGG
jgi:formamidopyrimidine-DNA glycosylase